MKIISVILLFFIQALWQNTPFARENPSPIAELSAEETKFLQGEIDYTPNFAPPQSTDKLPRTVASFLTNLQIDDSSGMSYQELLDQLINQDTERSDQANSDGRIPFIPGAFLNAAADLVETTANAINRINFSDLPKSNQQEQVNIEKDNWLFFADILRKEARIIGFKPLDLDDRIYNLTIQLDNAQKKGKAFTKIYIYSDTKDVQPEYIKILEDYPNIQIIFLPFPDDFNAFVEEVPQYEDGLIYLDVIPINYEPFYDLLFWGPFLSAIDPFYFGYPYDLFSFLNLYLNSIYINLIGDFDPDFNPEDNIDIIDPLPPEGGDVLPPVPLPLPPLLVPVPGPDWTDEVIDDSGPDFIPIPIPLPSSRWIDGWDHHHKHHRHHKDPTHHKHHKHHKDPIHHKQPKHHKQTRHQQRHQQSAQPRHQQRHQQSAQPRHQQRHQQSAQPRHQQRHQQSVQPRHQQRHQQSAQPRHQQRAQPRHQQRHQQPVTNQPRKHHR